VLQKRHQKGKIMISACEEYLPEFEKEESMSAITTIIITIEITPITTI
jgi:hypothetical protein